MRNGSSTHKDVNIRDLGNIMALQDEVKDTLEVLGVSPDNNEKEDQEF